MKVMLVNGSPHEKGSTYEALCEIARTLDAEGVENEIFWVGNKPISGCLGCGGCSKTNKCVIDDCVNAFIEKARSADGFVFGTPVHYAGASGAVTSFMDRVFFAADTYKTFALKPAACIAVARRGGASAAFDQLNKYFTISEMPVISSCYWNMVHGLVAEDVHEDLEGLLTMRTLARNMAWFLRCKEAGEQAGVKPPVREKRIATNFIRRQ